MEHSSIRCKFLVPETFKHNRSIKQHNFGHVRRCKFLYSFLKSVRVTLVTPPVGSTLSVGSNTAQPKMAFMHFELQELAEEHIYRQDNLLLSHLLLIRPIYYKIRGTIVVKVQIKPGVSCLWPGS